MATRIAAPATDAPPTELFDGLVPTAGESYFEEPYPDDDEPRGV